MISKKHVFWFTAGAFLGICVMLLSNLSHFAAARGTGQFIDTPLDTLIDEFEDGTLIRTALFRDLNSTLPENRERDGSVLLSPTGAMNEFQATNFLLPRPMIDHGAVSIGQRIYIIGGRSLSDINPDVPSVLLDDVWSGEIRTELDNEGRFPTGLQLTDIDGNPDNGGEWRSELPLPPTRGLLIAGAPETNLVHQPITATYQMAVVAFDHFIGGKNDYLYVLGGKTINGALEYSMSSVRIATVDPESGEITEWRTSQELESGSFEDGSVSSPLNLPEEFGLAGASAAITVIESTPYLYLIGGTTDAEDLGSKQGSDRVFYARIGLDDGMLYKPSTSGDTPANIGWEQMPGEIPVTTEGAGVWNAEVMISKAFDGKKALYVVGGQEVHGEAGQSDPQDTSSVHVADINIVPPEEDTDPPLGTLTWNQEKGANLLNALSSHTAVEYRGNFYVLGGYVDSIRAEPTDLGWTAYLLDDLSLNNFAPDSPTPLYFEVSNDPRPLQRPRAFHASVVVPDGYGNAFIYILGGRGAPEDADNTDDVASDKVYRYNVTNEPPDNSLFTSQGRYISEAYPIELDADNQIQRITWDAELPVADPSMDLVLEYRKTTLPQCNASTMDSLGVPWQTMDAVEDDPRHSATGTNVFIPPDEEIVNCFQYRAAFTSSSDRKLSPELKGIFLTVFIPGGPDLRIIELQPEFRTGTTDVLDDLRITIENKYLPEEDLTLDAAPTLADRGSFFVDLFVAGPGHNQTVITPTLPLTSTAYITRSTMISSTLYTTVDKAELPAKQNYTIPSGPVWCTPLNECGQTITSVIEETGTYTFCVALDSHVEPTDSDQDLAMGYVHEGLEGAEDNNFECVAFDARYVPPTPTVTPEPPTPPVVTTVFSATSMITDVGTVVGAFELSLDKGVAEDVTVDFTLNASAGLNRGQDYELYLINGDASPALVDTTNVVIPAGQTRVTLAVVLPDEPSVYNGASITLAIQSSEPYTVGTPNSATVTIEVETPAVFMPAVLKS